MAAQLAAAQARATQAEAAGVAAEADGTLPSRLPPGGRTRIAAAKADRTPPSPGSRRGSQQAGAARPTGPGRHAAAQADQPPRRGRKPPRTAAAEAARPKPAGSALMRIRCWPASELTPP